MILKLLFLIFFKFFINDLFLKNFGREEVFKDKVNGFKGVYNRKGRERD